MSTDRLRKFLDPNSMVPDKLQEFLEATEYEKRELLKLLKEAATRNCEALKIYEPLPFQDAFHRCDKKECILQKANRAGGSVAGFIEDARAVTGQDPYRKYPAEHGTLLCLGYGEPHIGRVIHKYLFRAGGFKMIRDLETNQWRVFRPWPATQEFLGKCGDGGREEEAKLAPPFIPPRYIESITWEKRSARIFSLCILRNGWEIYACNSAGDPSQAQGFNVNLYHIDEDTATAGWYEEALGRVAETKGFIRWTALPHAKNDDILNMIERAQREEEEDVPDAERVSVRITASMFDNPYYPEESRKANLKIWASQGDDVLRRRAYGELVLDTVKMYPTFSRTVHDVHGYKDAEPDVVRALRENAWEPPEDWCRDMIVDPGHTTCAVLFFTTPPSIFGDYRICYDELYMIRCDAHMFGTEVERKFKGRHFQRFIIDEHGGRLREIGSGITPRDQYSRQLKARGIACEETGHHFTSGTDDIDGRVGVLREWLRIRANGTPKLLINNERCPSLVREMLKFNKKTRIVSGHRIPMDEGNRSGFTHAVECCEYAAGHGLEYVRPKRRVVYTSAVKMILAGRKARAAQKAAAKLGSQDNSINLGPRGSSR